MPKFTSRPAPFHSPPIPVDAADVDFVRAEIARNLQLGSWAEVPERPQFCSAAFVVRAASSGKRRVVIDMRRLNTYLAPRPLRYESLRSARAFIARDDWFISMDLESGYHHVRVHPAATAYMGFELMGRFFVCTALPFGLATAPYVFSKVMAAPVRALRASGVRVLPYLDDFLFWFGSRAEALAAAVRVDALFASLGLRRHPTKGVWTPVQRLEHLGVVVDSAAGLFLPTERTVERVRGLARDLLVSVARHRRQVPFPLLRVFAGLCVSTRLVFPAARLHLGPIFDCFARARSAYDRVTLSSATVAELRFWGSGTWALGAPIDLPRPDLELFSDASDQGWGAHMGDMATFGYFSPAEAAQSSTARELRAALGAISAFGSALGGRSVQLSMDNMAASFGIINWASRSTVCRALLRQIYTELQRLRVHLWVRWIPRAENARADRLSKFRDRSDWKLAPWLFQWACRAYGRRDIDAFATQQNAHCPTFWAGRPMAGAAAVDALAQDWAGRRIWANPPWSLIGPVLRKAAATAQLNLVLVVPQWPHKPWWPTYLGLAAERRIVRPQFGLFYPGRGANQVPAPPPAWPVEVAWLVSR